MTGELAAGAAAAGHRRRRRGHRRLDPARPRRTSRPGRSPPSRARRAVGRRRAAGARSATTWSRSGCSAVRATRSWSCAPSSGRAIATRGPDGTWTAPKPLLRLRALRRGPHGHRDGRVRLGRRSRRRRTRLRPRERARRTDDDRAPRPEAAARRGRRRRGQRGRALQRRRATLSCARTATTRPARASTSLALPDGRSRACPRCSRPTASTSGPGRRATRRWDFGDGAVEDGLTRPHAYASGGRRTVDGAPARRGRQRDERERRARRRRRPGAARAASSVPHDAAARHAGAAADARLGDAAPPALRPAGPAAADHDEAGRAKVELAKQAAACAAASAASRRRGRAGGRAPARWRAARSRRRSPAARSGSRCRASAPAPGALRVVVTDAAGNASRARVLTVRVQLTTSRLDATAPCAAMNHASAISTSRWAALPSSSVRTQNDQARASASRSTAKRLNPSLCSTVRPGRRVAQDLEQLVPGDRDRDRAVEVGVGVAVVGGGRPGGARAGSRPPRRRARAGARGPPPTRRSRAPASRPRRTPSAAAGAA